ncbi:hypothetical protein TNCV_4000041 [Trichonephila clavipes]|nr:hypothetical protein TNCV_4000041 [Trichonephila clavipes]
MPKQPDKQKTTKNQPVKNIWTEERSVRLRLHPWRSKVHTTPTETLRLRNGSNVSKTNTFDANSIMEQMGQMMQQWGNYDSCPSTK